MYHVYTVNLFKLLTVCLLWNKLACRAWRFWLGALSNRGGRGQRNREEIEAGATWKNRLHGRGAFLSQSVRQRTDHSDWFRICSPVNEIFWYSPMGEFWGTEQIISAKQNQNIKEALTGASSILNIWRENRAIVLKPKQEMAIYSLLQRRDVMEILSTRFGKSMIFTVFAMAKEEISSSKTCIYSWSQSPL